MVTQTHLTRTEKQGFQHTNKTRVFTSNTKKKKQSNLAPTIKPLKEQIDKKWHSFYSESMFEPQKSSNFSVSKYFTIKQ